jgi:hypothetical protein
MNKNLILLVLITFFSCNKVSEKAQETINKSGELVGKTATEFVEGVSEGMDRSLDCKIVLSQDLLKIGLKTGKFYIENDSELNKDNKLVVYFIFDKDVNKKITAKIFDKKNLEMGRCNIVLKGKKNEAKFFDFVFDPRSKIEVKSNIIIE